MRAIVETQQTRWKRANLESKQKAIRKGRIEISCIRSKQEESKEESKKEKNGII
jgi:hypothetical protein